MAETTAEEEVVTTVEAETAITAASPAISPEIAELPDKEDQEADPESKKTSLF